MSNKRKKRPVSKRLLRLVRDKLVIPVLAGALVGLAAYLIDRLGEGGADK